MDEPLPLMGAPDAPSEEEYQAFVTALSESARGRALLAEHARRSRAADSEVLLMSVQRLEGLMRGYTEAPPPSEEPHEELRGMIEAIRGVQAELDISMLAEQVAKLATLIEGVQERIESIAVAAPAAPAAMDEPAPMAVAVTDPASEQTPIEAPAEAPTEAPMPPVTFTAPTDAALAGAELVFEDEVVFEGDAPGEPLPEAEIDFAGVAAAEPAVEPVVMAEAAVEAAASPEPDVATGGDAPAAAEAPAAPPASPTAGLAIAALVETLAVPEADADESEVKVYKAGSIPPPSPFAGEDFGPRGRAVPPPLDPLADLKSLTEDERLALFT